MRYIPFALSILFLAAACSVAPQVTNFEECVAATGQVMESYPRQCVYNGQTFVEEVESPIEAKPADAVDCPEERSQAVTREYMPVEASDGQMYDNWRMACANQEVMWYIPFDSQPQSASPEFTTCTDEQKQAEICTLEYNPVCGLVPNDIQCITAPCPTVDAVTYGNACGACAAQAEGWYPGECADLQFVVCQPTQTGFSAEEYAADSGGICVDVCPANMDSYVTQIGVEVCIVHYSEEEIQDWPVCIESSESCDCVKAVETTDNQQIDDAEYRCVPEQYSERMLFRSGVDRLDENGEQSVMIA